MSVPSDCLYSREHEWVAVEGDVATIGITTYAQQQLGEIVFSECSDVGATVEAGGQVGTIESVKAVGVLYSPVSGEVVEVNEAVTDDSELLNSDPHTNWMVKIRLSDASQLGELLSAEAYEAFVQES